MKYAVALLGLGLLAGPAAAASNCLLKVDGVVRLHKPCDVYISKFGTTTLGGGPGLTYFAVLPMDGGEGFWNEEKGAGHAHSPLGSVQRDGLCWRNPRVVACIAD